ncbi:MAG: glycosyltransferase [Ignavibacteriales bacterium]
MGISRLKQLPVRSDEELPTVSVILPARNEEANISATLTSLANQDYPKEKLTIVMVNDRSNDATGAKMQEFACRYKNFRQVNIEMLPEGFAPKKHALSKAISGTDSEMIITTDADCTHPAEWVRTLLSYFKEDTGLVTALTVFEPDDYTIYHRLHSLDFLSQAVVSAGAMGNNMPLMCSAPNLAYRRKAFDEIGGYGDKSVCVSGDDNLLLQNLVKLKKYKTAFAVGSGSIVKSVPPLTVSGVWHQRLRWGTQGFFYPAKVKLAGLMIFLYYLAIVLCPVLYFAGLISSTSLIVIPLIKIISDFIVIRAGFKKLKIKFETGIFLLLSAIHPMLIIATLISSFTMPFDWKGTSLKSRM